MDSEFTWTTFNNMNKIGIYLQQVRGVNIGGCSFESNLPIVDESDYYLRGEGIVVNNASFYLTKSGDQWCLDDDECKTVCYSNSALSKNNSFNNLFRAINISNIYYIPFSITNCSFENNKTAIEIAYSSDIAIKDNTFILNTTILNTLFEHWINNNYRAYFIKTNETQRFIIRDNSFNGTGNNIYGISVRECGNDQSNILANTISHSNSSNILSSGVRGIYLDGNCKYIYINCNTFSNQGADIFVDMGAIVYHTFSTSTQVVAFNPQNTGLTNTFSVLIPNRQNIVFYTPISVSNATINYFYFNQSQYNPGYNSITNHNPFLATSSQDIDICTKTCNQLKNSKLVNSNFFIYPNPNKDGLIFINNPYNVLYEISIYNNIGQLVYQCKNEKNQINVKLNSGIYHLQFKHNGIYESETLIIE